MTKKPRVYNGEKIVREKVVNVTHHQGNANQNYNEISPHTGQNGPHQKGYKQ